MPSVPDGSISDNPAFLREVIQILDGAAVNDPASAHGPVDAAVEAIMASLVRTARYTLEVLRAGGEKARSFLDALGRSVARLPTHQHNPPAAGGEKA
ncbi:hypothetical protein SAMN05421776_12147 [Nocardia farcinica]|uniref:Uncharacterized protein n=1 Tax=Nocardia farcinica TaxID=37329 RepID=A0A0H5PAD4_NOCFR|nr:hypothetical protein CJ469_05819 [Nocardia farcinica]PFX04464.1 hypothetical protein CJ468_05440 [Nocardia farcinica]CRY84229.1 Uncharacterised protein [Nocardia farcinica]SIT34107.1 hypothetical protein SAMN05421776_12147 [Nocardia farcinica]